MCMISISAFTTAVQDIKVPFRMDGGNRVDDTPVHQALREALANCLGQCGLLWQAGAGHPQKAGRHHHVQPRSFRIELDAAKSRRRVRSRNGTMLKMFNLTIP